jgi:hypothetical protein
LPDELPLQRSTPKNATLSASGESRMHAKVYLPTEGSQGTEKWGNTFGKFSAISAEIQ